jgi:serine/threonine protein kinase
MTSDRESVDRQRWEELKTLFSAAIERAPADWPPMVSSVRERDPNLADQLQRLLDGHADTLIPVNTVRLTVLQPGTRLGPYVLRELIGEGGMGRVYRARDERLDREVAVKVLLPELAHDPERRTRMEREARAMGVLNHPNIVTVYDIGDHDGSPFIVSELLEGQTLREQMSAGVGAGHRLRASEAVEIVAAVADALGAAHGRGIVHRDIKPENIFITREGRIKVLDFGIAKLIDVDAAREGTVADTIIGTVSYMTPEQLRGDPVSAATDVYACGVVLYELLCGARPYAGKSQAVLIGAILHEPPPPLLGTAPALAALVARCLDKRPEARYANGAELGAALRTLPVFAAKPDHARRTAAEDAPVEETTAKRTRLVAGLMVLVAGVTIVSLVWRQRSDDALPASTPTGARLDITLSAPASPAVVTDAPPRASAPRSVEAQSLSPVPPPPQRASTSPEPQPPAVDPGPRSTLPPSTPSLTAPPLSGIWVVSEQIAEDVHAIECAASGALQIRFDDGLLDGTLRLKRDCKDAKRLTTDSTEATAGLSAGTHTGDAVSFVTRIVDEGLATTCRYSGQIVGNSRAAMVGEVTCEARSVGVSAVLALRGTWRANRTSP